MTVDLERSVVLIGGHDTGKSNYLARLWLALRKGDGILSVPEDPENIEYVESLIRALQSGTYAGRTNRDDHPRLFEGLAIGGAESDPIRIVVPDVYGELWEKTSEQREIGNAWIARIRQASGALLFLRLGSSHHIELIDWITSPALMAAPLAAQVAQEGMPTQIFLTDMINFLESNLGLESSSSPRLSIVIAAWDLVPPEQEGTLPRDFLAANYPLLDGRLDDCRRLSVNVFAASITGGDLKTAEHRDLFLQSSADKEGFVVYDDGQGNLRKERDLTVPVAWAIGLELPEAD